MSRWAVGIDLGTTHCAMARVALDGDGAPEVLDVPQLVGVGQLAARPLLPSFLYVGAEGETLALPWDGERGFAVGEHARSRGPEVPGRVVASAKSWLCHPSTDRRAGLLPLAAADDIEKISPVEASYRYLEHLAEAYDATHAGDGGRLADQAIVLAVPASFDAGARELTVEAALAAGLEDLTLLEEPQAALYAWLERRGDGWRGELRPGDVVLVVDVGGGTSDFSAIEVRDEGGELALVRVAVGDHLLLGGDNMDLALAHRVRARLEAELDAWQMASLAHAARAAKEKLLGDAAVASVPVVVARRGAKLVGGGLRADVTRDELGELVLDGFFPRVGPDARPTVRPRAGLTQIGLPYAADPAVTKHLAAFLARQASAVVRPTCLLFNGGVMKSAILRDRLQATVDDWLAAAGAPPVRPLVGADLDLSVARGAAWYGRVRHGHGVRIRGGTARAYYVGIESAVPAVPGVEPPVSLLCVAPFGMEEGSRASLPPEPLAVVVGEPVRFRFFGSTVRRQDAAGAVLARWSEAEVAELAPIEIVLPADERTPGDVVPVTLGAGVTEVGTLLLEAVPLEPRRADERWKVELSVRERA
jgi:molecular chaperone DnaK (HSP70)